MPKREGPRTNDGYENLGPKSPRRKSLVVRESRSVEVVSLMRRGYTQGEIAEKLGITKRVVDDDWNFARRELRLRREKDTKEQVQMMLDELDEIKREAWEEWERSKLPAVEVLEEEAERPMGSSSRRQKTRKGRLGDPRYLTVVQNCLDAQAELLALYPAKNSSLGITVIPWDALQGLVAPPSLEDMRKQIEGQVISSQGQPSPSQSQEPPQTGPTLTSTPDFTSGSQSSPNGSKPQSQASLPRSSSSPVYPDTIEGKIVELTARARATQKVKAQEDARNETFEEE